MTDGGWMVGLLTLVAVAGGGWAIGEAMWRAMKAPLAQVPRLDMKAILAKQARQAEARGHREGLGSAWEAWLDAFAAVLMAEWGMTYDEARQAGRLAVRDYGMVFHDADHDWTPEGARRFARVYMQENGEHYGNNG